MAKIITRSGAGSSAVRRLTFSEGKSRMAVTYRSGKTYTYDGVSKRRFGQITKAASLGKAINQMKGKVAAGRLVKPGPGGLKSAMRARKRGGSGGRTDG